LFSDYVLFYNNRKKNIKGSQLKAGTLVAIRIPVFEHYSAENLLVEPGHSQCVLLTPLDPNRAVITVSNLRFQTGSGKTEKQTRAIGKLRRLLPPAHVRYLLGDLNFTSGAEDSSGGIPDEPPNWSVFLREFSFQEVPQENHTWFSTNSSSPCSSRIDRIYLSIPEVEWLLSTPTSRVLEEALDDIEKQHKRQVAQGLRGSEGLNTHLPVGLKFFLVPDLPKRKQLHINVFQDPLFLVNFSNVYKSPSDLALQRNPVNCLRRFKKAIHQAYRNTVSAKHKPDRIKRYSVCLLAFRELNKPLPRFKFLKKLCEENEFLRDLIYWTGSGWEFKLLKAALTRALLGGLPDPAELNRDAVPTAMGKNTRNSVADTLKNLKFILPSTRRRVSCLSADHASEPTSDPIPLGDIIKSFWGNVWSPPSSNQTKQRKALVDEYLLDYDLQITAADTPELEVKHVTRSILTSGNSAVGPDGIPFIAYRVTVEEASRVLFAYAVHLRNTPSDLTSFNAATLLLLPKSHSLMVKDTRPLCINNTDNRIIAHAFVILITPKVDLLVDTAQQGFIKGRLMSKHLHDLNSEFYSAWSSDEDYFILFTDNAKAFDSIYHDFILEVLKKQSFPDWFVSTVKSLLSNVSVRPTLAPATSIGVGRGVKQGCPLSPILFVLIYDPLVRFLKRSKELNPKAAADDLAVGSYSLETLFTEAIPLIDAFCDASGMGINKSKSVILSSCPLEDPPTHPSFAKEKCNMSPTAPTVLIEPNEALVDVNDNDPLGYTDNLDLIGDESEPENDCVSSQVSTDTIRNADPIDPEPPSNVSSDHDEVNPFTDPKSVLTPPSSPIVSADPVFPNSKQCHTMSLRVRLVPAQLPAKPVNTVKSSRARKIPGPGTSLTTVKLPTGPGKQRRKGPRLTQPKKTSHSEHLVNSIVDKRWNPYQHPSKKVDPEKRAPFGFWEYNVRWRGYGPKDDTWEPLVNLSCCTETVKEFETTWSRPLSLWETLQAGYSSCPEDWKGIKLVNHTKYLGVYFSNSKDTYATMELNFNPVLIKARDRLSSYRVVLKNVSLSTRILIVNVFVTSLFSYLIGFMLIPFPFYWEYRSMVSRAVVPYHGSAFRYEHLTMPPLLMGVKPCLSDLWVQNVFRLLSRSSFRKLGPKLYDSLPWPLGTNDSNLGVSYFSPLFDDSVNLALMEFIGPKFLAWDGVSDLSNLKDVEIKRLLVKHGLHQVKDHSEKERSRFSDLVTKFGRFSSSPTNTLAHFATISPSTPNSHLEHNLLLYTNALATDKRIRHFVPDSSVHPAKNQWYPYPCYFCSLGNDSVQHIYGECGVVRGLLTALTRRGVENCIPLTDPLIFGGVSLVKPLFIMDFPLAKRGGQHGAAFLLAFNKEVWHLRNDLRAGGTSLICIDSFRKKLKVYSHLWEADRPKKVSGSVYGSASRRTKAQKVRCYKDASMMVNSAGLDATLAFTDGSSIGNPGPSGAGAYVALRTELNWC
jgi:hypothetical protein